jgi:hypothetical protein
MKVYLGCDHGAQGALAAINEDGEILHYTKMPLKPDGTIDAFQIYSWLYENFDEYDYEVTVCGEKLHAIFKAAASTTFSFGKNVGTVTGIIECLEMYYFEVRAVDWQKHMFTKYEIPITHQKKKTPSGKLKNDTKAMAKDCLKKIYPTFESNHDGIIDALLIANYAKEIK